MMLGQVSYGGIPPLNGARLFSHETRPLDPNCEKIVCLFFSSSSHGRTRLASIWKEEAGFDFQCWGWASEFFFRSRGTISIAVEVEINLTVTEIRLVLTHREGPHGVLILSLPQSQDQWKFDLNSNGFAYDNDQLCLIARQGDSCTNGINRSGGATVKKANRPSAGSQAPGVLKLAHFP